MNTTCSDGSSPNVAHKCTINYLVVMCKLCLQMCIRDRQLLEAGKSVVTSNKELVAKHGTELLKIAKDNNVCLLYTSRCV